MPTPCLWLVMNRASDRRGMTWKEPATRIDWIGSSCRLLQGNGRGIRKTRGRSEALPSAPASIWNRRRWRLLMTLRAGGARLDLHRQSEQHAAVDRRLPALRRASTVFGDPDDRSRRASTAVLEAVVAERPDLLLDNGGDLFAIASPSVPMPACSAAPRKRPQAARACCRCATKLEHADPGHQRQPDQAIRRKQACRGPEPVRKLHALHQPLHQRQARDRLRLWRLRQGDGRLLPQRLLDASASSISIPVTALEAHLDGFVTPLRNEAIRSAPT